MCIWRWFFWPCLKPQNWLIATVTAVDASRHALPHRELWRLAWCRGSWCQTVITSTRFLLTREIKQEPSSLMFHTKTFYVCVCLWVFDNAVKALDAAKCQHCTFVEICQHVYTTATDSKEQKLVFSCVLVCRSVWIDLWWAKKVLASVLVHEYQLYRPLFFSSGKETRNLKGSWWHERIRCEGKISESAEL